MGTGHIGIGKRPRGATGTLAGMAVAVAGLSAARAASAAVIINDGFGSGASGTTLAGGTPDATNTPGGTYQLNGASAFATTYLSVSGMSVASVGADDGAFLATGVTTPVVYSVGVTYSNNNIGDTAGTLQRGEGLGFVTAPITGANGFHGVGSFTGVIVSPVGVVRLVSVSPNPSAPEPVVTDLADYTISGYSNVGLHSLSYDANTSSGLVSNVMVDGSAIPLPSTTPIFTAADTATVGFTASGNGGSQTAYFDNFTVATTAVASVPEPTTAGLLGVAAAGLIARRRRRPTA